MKTSVSTMLLRRVTDNLQEFEKTVEFLRLVWPGVDRLNHEYLRWLYFNNPDGQVIGMNAWHGEQIVGHYVTIPIATLYRGQPKSAALSLNTAVHPYFRGQGLFTKLAEETYALAQELGVDHIVGVANANSTAGFTRSLRFQLVSPLEAKILFALPHLGDGQARTVWKRLWSAEALPWRLKNPAFKYTFRSHREFTEINGATPYPGLQSVLMFTNDAETGATIRQHIPAKGSLWPARLWIGLDRNLHFSKLSSLEVPKPLRKAPLNLIYRSLSNPAEQLDSREVEFAAIDFDVV